MPAMLIIFVIGTALGFLLGIIILQTYEAMTNPENFTERAKQLKTLQELEKKIIKTQQSIVKNLKYDRR